MSDLRLMYYHVLFLFLYLIDRSSGAPRFPMAKPGCNDTCGGVTIPYPFGIGPGCALNQAYTINCTDLSGHSFYNAKPYLYLGPQPGKGSQEIFEVLEVSLSDQTVTINHLAQRVCWSKEGTDVTMSYPLLDGSPFFFSPEHNKMMYVGCGTALLTSDWDSPEILAGCTSICTSKKTTGCYGLNCCEASIPYYLSAYNFNFTAYQNFTNSTEIRCVSALLVDQTWKYKNILNPLMPEGSIRAPVVVSWTIQNQSDINATSGCHSREISLQLQSSNISSYHCECNILVSKTWIHEINPYIHGACNNATSIIGESWGIGGILITIGVTVGTGVIILMITTFTLYNMVKKRFNIKRKEKFFRRMLRQQLSPDNIENTKLFTAKELSKATDGFSKDRILGQGGQGTVYKGMLTDGKIVAIKKAKSVDDSRFEQFVNETVILSQVNHRNVVKLLGCCLATKVPLLVYEFIPNGTLSDLIHNQNDVEFPFTWDLRLRLAIEIAGALKYLHSDISYPILHGDIKSSNILLDEKYIAKLSDFGTSRSIEVDATHWSTEVKGTFGYLDPEYFQSGQYTAKSDVYSFGVVLVELITRQKPIPSKRSGEDVASLGLADKFLKSMNRNSLKRILDPQLVDKRNEEEVFMVAKLAEQCLNSSGKKRPTMKEALTMLESIKSSKGDSTVDANFENPSAIEEEGTGNYDTTYYTWTIGGDNFESDSDAYPIMYKTV